MSSYLQVSALAPGVRAAFAAAATASVLWCALAARPAAAADAAPGAPVAAHWQAQKVEFSYTGFTTHYSCDGIEDKVTQVLRHFGARADLKVRATGCDMGTRRVGPFAWVRAEFNTLAPGAGEAGSATVDAHWQAVKLSAGRPLFMDEGECELVEQLKPLLQKNFALRDLDVRTTCIAHQVSVHDYNVTAQALIADKPAGKG